MQFPYRISWHRTARHESWGLPDKQAVIRSFAKQSDYSSLRPGGRLPNHPLVCTSSCRSLNAPKFNSRVMNRELKSFEVVTAELNIPTTSRQESCHSDEPSSRSTRIDSAAARPTVKVCFPRSALTIPISALFSMMVAVAPSTNPESERYLRKSGS